MEFFVICYSSFTMETSSAKITKRNTKEDILAAKRKASKERYGRIKSDAKLSKIYKEKEKLNYLKKKEKKTGCKHKGEKQKETGNTATEMARKFTSILQT